MARQLLIGIASAAATLLVAHTAARLTRESPVPTSTSTSTPEQPPAPAVHQAGREPAGSGRERMRDVANLVQAGSALSRAMEEEFHDPNRGTPDELSHLQRVMLAAPRGEAHDAAAAIRRWLRTAGGDATRKCLRRTDPGSLTARFVADLAGAADRIVVSHLRLAAIDGRPPLTRPEDECLSRNLEAVTQMPASGDAARALGDFASNEHVAISWSWGVPADAPSAPAPADTGPAGSRNDTPPGEHPL
jgi:hypothetical protein